MTQPSKPTADETDLFSVPKDIIWNREEHILAQCEGKSVLHLGCCDHPFTEDAIREGRWLHDRIAAVASRLTGLDLSEQGLDACKRMGRGDDIVLGDACSIDTIPGAPFERIVAGEIIEHVPNPGGMLTNMRQFLAPGGHLIVTTPNAFSLRKQLRVMTGKESVHRDHICYFSHRTLAQLLRMSGYEVIQQSNVALHRHVPPLSRALEKAASILNSGMLEGLYVEARPTA